MCIYIIPPRLTRSGSRSIFLELTASFEFTVFLHQNRAKTVLLFSCRRDGEEMNSCLSEGH